MSDGADAVDYRAINQGSWNELVRVGCRYTRPCSREDLARARTLLDPQGWLTWSGIRTVLCLASGGGQQGPQFASLGIQTTVVDLSPAQLEQDQRTAAAFGLQLETLQLDMQDLSALDGRHFDLVYQPVSANYVPDVRAVYREVRRVLRPGGAYLITHWNAICLQMPETDEWDGGAYRLVEPQRRGHALPQRTWVVDGTAHPITTLHYMHSLEDQIGGLLEAGFVLERLSEPMRGDVSAAPGSMEHLAAYVPPCLRMLARAGTGPGGTAR